MMIIPAVAVLRDTDLINFFALAHRHRRRCELDPHRAQQDSNLAGVRQKLLTLRL